MKKALLFDAVGKIDTDILESYALMDQRLRSRRRTSKAKRYLFALLAAALAMVLTFALLLTSLPLIYITNAEKINTAISDVVDGVMFPMDQVPEGEEIKQEDLLLNWVEWDFTKEFFSALGAGTDDSVIDKLQGMQSDGLAGESMQSLGDLLARLYEYYLKYKGKYDTDQGKEDSESADAPNQTVHLDGCTYQFNNYYQYYELASVDYFSSDRQGVFEVPTDIEGYPVGEINKDAFRNNKDLKKLIMSDTIDSIGINAFYGCEDLEEIYFSAQLRSVGKYAFAGCSALTEVTLPENVSSVGERAFVNCRSLANASLPSSLNKIPDYCFAGCTNLTEVVVGNAVSSIGVGAFSGCTSLERINLPQSLDTIDRFAFENCGLKEVTIPNGTKVIGEYAFSGCGQLQSVELGNSVTTIQAYAFEKTGLTYVHIPSSVQEMGGHAFDTVSEVSYNGTQLEWFTTFLRSSGFIFGHAAQVKCEDGACYADYTPSLMIRNDGMTEDNLYAYCIAGLTVGTTDTVVILPPFETQLDKYIGIETIAIMHNEYIKELYMGDTYEYIGYRAFMACSFLETVQLSAALQTLEGESFRDCVSLTSLEIPTSVVTIGSLAFAGCSSLSTVQYLGAMDQWQQIELAQDAFDSGVTIVCTDGEIVIE